MIHASFAIDLPSEPYPASTLAQTLVRKIFFEPDAHTGRKHITISVLDVLSRLGAALRAADFDDVICIQVGAKTVYVDTEERMADLEFALERTLDSGSLRNGLRDVQVVVSRTSPSIHSLLEVRVNDDVLLGQSELTLQWCSRISGLRVRKDESLAEYLARIAASVAQGAFETATDQARRQTRECAEALRGPLEARNVWVSPVIQRVVVPGPTQVGRFRHLRFGPQLRTPIYRPDPRQGRAGIDADAHNRFYYDPYHNLLCWLLVAEAQEGRWAAAGVEFVSPDGHILCTGGDELRGLQLEVRRDAVAFREDRIEVADHIPQVGLDRAEIGSPNWPGYGGEGH